MDTCWRCGGLYDVENMLFTVTRLDPHTRILRRVTEEELGEMPDDFKEAHNFGYRVSAICLDCKEEHGR